MLAQPRQRPFERLVALGEAQSRELLVVPFVPVSGQSDEQIARFDVVLGITPSF